MIPHAIVFDCAEYIQYDLGPNKNPLNVSNNLGPNKNPLNVSDLMAILFLI